MNSVDIIAKKRDGESLTKEEIDFFIKGYTDGDIPEYQAAAWCMAIFFQGMNRQETVDLTLAMAASGEQMDLHDTLDYVLDKHSSGGVGDKTTLVVLPMVAACGVPVAKMSGRGLGFTGGTLDKMESICGWRCDLDLGSFKQQVSQIGLALAGQTAALAPADGKLYKLRDVTATVRSMPLIAASIMSKKLAAGSDGIVLDVKVGSGAFLTTVEEGQFLARVMVDIGTDAGRDVVALLSDMNQPLGFTAGNALEVKEAVLTLKNDAATPADFWHHCLAVGRHMLHMARPELSLADAESQLITARESGAALEKFVAMVQAQGGDAAVIHDLAKLPTAPVIQPVVAPSAGYLAKVDTAAVGMVVVEMGGGRRRKEDPIDPAVGLEFPVKIGDTVNAGDTIATLHTKDAASFETAKAALLAAITISPDPVDPLPHFYGVVE